MGHERHDIPFAEEQSDPSIFVAHITFCIYCKRPARLIPWGDIDSPLDSVAAPLMSRKNRKIFLLRAEAVCFISDISLNWLLGILLLLSHYFVTLI